MHRSEHRSMTNQTAHTTFNQHTQTRVMDKNLERRMIVKPEQSVMLQSMNRETIRTHHIAHTDTHDIHVNTMSTNIIHRAAFTRDELKY